MVPNFTCPQLSSGGAGGLLTADEMECSRVQSRSSEKCRLVK